MHQFVKEGLFTIWSCTKSNKMSQKTNKPTLADLMKEIKLVREEMGELKKEIAGLNQNIEEIVEAKVEERLQAIQREITAEEFDKEGKKDELVVYKIPEPNNKTGRERQEADQKSAAAKLTQFCKGIDVKDIEFVRRMGKYNPQTSRDRPRPLLIGFYERECRNKALANARRAKDLTVKPSLTRAQRRYISDLHEEKESKNSNETDETFHWIVSGAPGKELLRRVKKRRE